MLLFFTIFAVVGGLFAIFFVIRLFSNPIKLSSAIDFLWTVRAGSEPLLRMYTLDLPPESQEAELVFIRQNKRISEKYIHKLLDDLFGLIGSIGMIILGISIIILGLTKNVDYALGLTKNVDYALCLGVVGLVLLIPFFYISRMKKKIQL